MQCQRPALVNEKFKHIFIQSPFTLLTEVQSFTSSFISPREKSRARAQLLYHVTRKSGSLDVQRDTVIKESAVATFPTEYKIVQ